MGKALTLILLAAALAGCTTTRPNPVGLPCTVGPFRPDTDVSERWTEGELDQLIVLNESGEKLCGWAP